MSATSPSPHSDRVETQTGHNWDYQWQKVPASWREPRFRLDRTPGIELFVRNRNYQSSQRVYDFSPDAPRVRDELAWWLWTIWAEGSQKADPAMLNWWVRSINSLTYKRSTFSANTSSITDFAPSLVSREAILLFRKKNSRDPSPNNLRNLESITDSIHRHVTVRCTDAPWWSHDVWDLRLDARIPHRDHEPHGDRVITLADITPEWLKEGLRFWLYQALTLDIYTWTSAATRITHLGNYFGRYLTEENIGHPHVATGLQNLRAEFLRFLSWLQSPPATNKNTGLSATGAAAVQSTIQRFYEFMYDHAAAATQFTGNPEWQDLTADHTRLWAPSRQPRRQGKETTVNFYESAEISRMVQHLEVLTTPTDQTVEITDTNQASRQFRGLGDPQAARAWLLQAMTGRRASEVLMLDFDPLTMLNVESSAPEAFIARLHYQQTKVDGVDPTILVDGAVVRVIQEQQAWVQQTYDLEPDPPYLFLNPRGNYKALRPRSYRSYSDALKRLDKTVNLTNGHGAPLAFTKTHRLRHSRATELLNNGVPIHVVQRYLGHRSPEMTMRYAHTLAATAEAEFLKFKKVGADGRDLGLSTHDLLEISQLDQRADRILPNGYCMLPPTQSCDKGNACLPCGSFATDQTHLPEHRAQRDRLLQLIASRKDQYQTRHGQPMPETNIWLTGRMTELVSLEAIITRLEQDPPEAVTGAGTQGRQVTVELVTDPDSRRVLQNKLDHRMHP